VFDAEESLINEGDVFVNRKLGQKTIQF